MKMRQFRWLFAIVLAGLTAIILTACDNPTSFRDNNDDYEYESTADIDLTISIGNHDGIEVNNVNGPLEIITVPGLTQIHVAGERIARARSQRRADDLLDALTYSVGNNGSKMVVHSQYPENTKDSDELQIRYIITIPQNWSVEANLVLGSVDIDTLGGDAIINVTDGNIHLRKVEGNLLADLVNGNIYANVDLPQNHSCQINVVNGLIEFSIPSNSNVDFLATVTNGLLTLNNLTLTNMVSTARSVQGRIGNGGSQIKLQTVNGSILASGY